MRKMSTPARAYSHFRLTVEGSPEQVALYEEVANRFLFKLPVNDKLQFGISSGTTLAGEWYSMDMPYNDLGRRLFDRMCTALRSSAKGA